MSKRRRLTLFAAPRPITYAPLTLPAFGCGMEVAPRLLDGLEHNLREKRSALKQDDARFSQPQQ
jgi:hypothetical protein